MHYLHVEGDGNGGQCKGRGQHCVFVDGEHGQHGLHGEGNGDGNGGGHSQCKGGGQHCVFDVVQTVSGLSFSISSLTTKVTRMAKKIYYYSFLTVWLRYCKTKECIFSSLYIKEFLC